MLDNVWEKEDIVSVLVILLFICITVIIIMSLLIYFLLRKSKDYLYIIKRMRSGEKKTNSYKDKQKTVAKSSESKNKGKSINTNANVPARNNTDSPVTPTKNVTSENEAKNLEKMSCKDDGTKMTNTEILKKESFNSSLSKSEEPCYTNLSIDSGSFVESTIGKTPYYRYWQNEGKLFFEFFCEESLLSKAINNHSVIIDPFCQKSNESISHAEAKSILTIKPGELDSNLKIVSKSIIKYI